jgi:hypothetical protein
LTLFNASHAIATVAGAACGGCLLYAMGTDHTAYLTLFAISSVARGVTLALLARASRVLPARDPASQPVPIPTRVVTVGPQMGSTERPILPAFSPEAARVELATQSAAKGATLLSAAVGARTR